MYTLYDLLGARPQDDAKTLKKAFRKAAKATYPDVNAGDPDAQLRFSQVVRAYDILSDAEKRAAYDRFLDFGLRQPRFEPNRSILSNTVNELVSDVIAVGILAVASLGGFGVFAYLHPKALSRQATMKQFSRASTRRVLCFVLRYVCPPLSP